MTQGIFYYKEVVRVNRRNFLVNFILWVFSFVVGYKISNWDTKRPHSEKDYLRDNINKKKNTWINIVEDYGADPTGTTDNKDRINEALAYLSSIGGGVLFFPPNATILTKGDHIISSNIKVKGSINSVIKLSRNTYASIFLTNPLNESQNIEFEDITLDGNYSGSDHTSVQKSFHTLYVRNVKKLKIDNVTIENPVAWCANIVNCDNVSVSRYQAFSAGNQMDGLHFVDCNNVRVNDVYCDTGDDCIGVTVDNNQKITNHFFSNIYGKSKIGSLVRLNQSDRSFSNEEVKAIENMHFLNICGENCGNRGFSMSSILPNSTVTDIHVKGSFKETTREGVRINKAKRLFLEVDIVKCGTGEILKDGSTFDSVLLDWVDDGTINVKISDVTNGRSGLRFRTGSRNKIHANIDYVVGSKINRQPCVILENTTYTKLSGELMNSPIGVQLGAVSPPSGALHNIIRDCFIIGASTYAIQEVGTSNHNMIQKN